MELLSSWGGLGLPARLPSWGDQAMLVPGQDPPPGWDLHSLLLVGPPGSPDRRPSWDVLPALEDPAPVLPQQQPQPVIQSHSHSSSSTSDQVLRLTRCCVTWVPIGNSLGHVVVLLISRVLVVLADSGWLASQMPVYAWYAQWLMLMGETTSQLFSAQHA